MRVLKGRERRIATAPTLVAAATAVPQDQAEKSSIKEGSSALTLIAAATGVPLDRAE